MWQSGVKVCTEPKCPGPQVLGSCLYITLLLKLTNPKQCPSGLWLPARARPGAVLLQVQPAVEGWGWRGEDATRGPGDRAVRDACTPVSLGPWRDCLQALEDGHDTSSIYLVKPENTNRLMQVWCDQRHDPGGWTVIQRRLDGSVNFFRNWETYKVRTPTYTERQGPRREACVAPREVDPDRASRWGGPAAPPLPHQQLGRGTE